MALVRCPECGREVSEHAAACPNCGYPIAAIRPSTAANQVPSSAPQVPYPVNSATPLPKSDAAVSQPTAEKRPSCLRIFVGIILFAAIVLFLLIGLVLCTHGGDPSRGGSSSGNAVAVTEGATWYQNLTAAAEEAGLDAIERTDTTVTLREQDEEGGYKEVTNGRAYGDFDNSEILTREAIVTTISGRRVEARFYDNDRVYKLVDADDFKTVYWALPDADGDYAEDIVSFATGEITHHKDEEKAAAAQESLEEYQEEQAKKPKGAEKDFVDDMAEYYGWDESSARDAYSLLCELGCSGAVIIGGSMTNNESLQAMRAEVNGHQINFTAENKEIFYVQITGWKEQDYGWYLNWRGKLKYGIFDSKLSFDLYDSSEGNGFLAYYDRKDDSVIPWSER